MKTAVIIPNWNGEEFLADSIESLEKQTYPAKIILVDNGSTDNSVKIVKNKFPEVQIVQLDANTGFTGGVNAGFEEALKEGYEAIALFNNDAEATPKWLEGLVNVLEAEKKAGIATCKFMRFDKKTFDSTGDFYTTWGIPFPRGRNQKDNGQYSQPEEVFGATGGASIYRASMLKEIGLMDERFFAYIEDVDVSFRARLAGWKVFYEPKSVAYHRISATSSKFANSFGRYHWIKNYAMTYLKNMPGFLFWKYLPLVVLQIFVYLIRSITKREFIAYLKGVVSLMRFLPGLIIDRRKIQSNRKVSAGQIDAQLTHARPPKIPII